MKNLFLIDGASGIVKADIIEYISTYKTNISYIKKYTTRKVRESEKLDKEKIDLIHIQSEEFDKCNFDYKYIYGEQQYGFYKHIIINTLKSSDNVLIIIRNADLINKLKQDFQAINVISIFIYTDKYQVINRLKKDGYNVDHIRYRVKRLDFANRSYLYVPNIYDEIIINQGGDFQRMIDNTINKYILVQQQVDPNFIFVIMSFDKKYDHIFEEFKDAAR